MQHEPLIIERIYNAPVSLVWKALTEVDRIKKWSFDMPDFKPEVGCEFTFYGHKDNVTYKHLSTVMEVIPERKLTYSWRYEGYEGNSFVTFELFPEGDNTKVVLTHIGLETFPAHADFTRKDFVAGWTEIIGKLFKSYVES